MLDVSTSLSTPSHIAEWRNHLSPGDIVMFHFPIVGQAASASPAPRPCLILDIEVKAGQRCAVLTPASPARRPAGHDRAVSVTRGADYRAAGLDRPTMFSIRLRRLVPLAHRGFVVSQSSTGTPVLGRLPEPALELMHAERARLHALRDIRADRAQSSQRQSRRRAPSRGHDFTVERRQPRRPVPMPQVSAALSGI